MSQFSIPKPIADDIDYFAEQPATQVSLRQLYEYARVADEHTFIGAAQFLHRELPIRLAKKVKELEAAPGGLADYRDVQIVREWYFRSFMDVVDLPYPRTVIDEQHFTEAIDKIKDRHRNQVAVMARGIREYTDRYGAIVPGSEIQTFLDGFFLSRIGIRVLIGHHVASHKHRDGWVGIICAQTSPAEVAEEAAAHAGDICRATFGDPPPVEIRGRLNLRLKYIPSHLHHIFFELFKNSFRASIEHHGAEGKKLPPVHVIIAGGMEDVSIKVSDEGGGIPRSGITRIWSYGYTTVKQLPDVGGDGTVMAGLGYGLPLSRLYARYFGGDLQVISLEGFGTDAFLHMSRLGTRAEYIH